MKNIKNFFLPPRKIWEDSPDAWGKSVNSMEDIHSISYNTFFCETVIGFSRVNYVKIPSDRGVPVGVEIEEESRRVVSRQIIL